MEQGRIVERGTHEQLYGAQGRYYDLYTRQQGVEHNLFLAPGEGDKLEEPGDGNGGSVPVSNGDAKAADALRVLRGEVR
jgi:subfamily B ATP-binding cassette protein MsbA